jgi:DNA-binding MarR family transcriptional regulator
VDTRRKIAFLTPKGRKLVEELGALMDSSMKGKEKYSSTAQGLRAWAEFQLSPLAFSMDGTGIVGESAGTMGSASR